LAPCIFGCCGGFLFCRYSFTGHGAGSFVVGLMGLVISNRTLPIFIDAPSRPLLWGRVLSVLSLADWRVYTVWGRSWGEGKVTNVYMNEDDARIVCEGDVNLLRVSPKYSGNMPSGIVTKPPKPVSSVSAVPTWGIFRNFSLFCGVGGLYRGGVFSTVSPGSGLVFQRGRCLTKSLDDSSQGGGDVCYPLESSHQGARC
jgi:hypothetical protein